jgi:class 3 adenylate cyclase
MKRLDTERKLNLALVDQMFPEKVADALRSGQPVLPEAYEDVTIFFSDVEGFTKMSTVCDPIEIVQFLNELYTVMDHCASLFPLYKVETIGDAYMVVSGLPDPDCDHVSHIVSRLSALLSINEELIIVDLRNSKTVSRAIFVSCLF